MMAITTSSSISVNARPQVTRLGAFFVGMAIPQMK
jgi:hypothetical protein